MQRPGKAEYYLQIAKAVAMRSTCLRTHYGSVVVLKDRIVSTGFNGGRRGGVNCCDRGHCLRANAKTRSNYENCPAVHSEISSLTNSITDIAGAAIYIAGYRHETEEERVGSASLPCKNCYRALCNAQIEGVWIRGVTLQPQFYTMNELSFLED